MGKNGKREKKGRHPPNEALIPLAPEKNLSSETNISCEAAVESGGLVARVSFQTRGAQRLSLRKDKSIVSNTGTRGVSSGGRNAALKVMSSCER